MNGANTSSVNLNHAGSSSPASLITAMPPLNEALPGGKGWVTIEGHFLMVGGSWGGWWGLVMFVVVEEETVERGESIL